MARLMTCGFELGGSVAVMPTGYEINSATAGTAALSIQSTQARSGTYALRCTGLSSGTQSYVKSQFAAAAATWYARVYLYITTLPNVESTLIRFDNGGNSFDLRVGDTVNMLTLYFNNVVQAPRIALTTGVWYRIELAVDTSPVGGSETADLYLDGAHVVTATGTFITGGNIWLGGNIKSETATVGDWLFDDIAVNDNSGSAQTGLPGAGNIVHLWPNGDGDADTTVTRSSGGTSPTGTDRGNNYQQLGADFDKPSPNDGTDFLLLTANTSEVLVDCEAASVPGIGATDTITLVQVGGRVAVASAAGGNFIPEIMSQSAGTKLAGTTSSIASVTWNTNDDSSGLSQLDKLISYTDPQAGGAWTVALLNSMQIGAKTTDGNPDTLISALWAVVEYVSTAAPRYLLVRN